MKKLLAFDLDGTLAESKSVIEDSMSDLLGQLLNNFKICVISGGRFEQFEKQFIKNLKVDPEKLKDLHIMPTCGTRYYQFDTKSKTWQRIYAEDFTELEKEKILKVLNKVVDDLGYREAKTWGPDIEDRGSQITFSALGQNIVEMLRAEGIRKKEAWDPDNKKKAAIVKEMSKLLPEFEVRSGGLTSVDITKPGIDKAYGINKILKSLGLTKDEVLFIGDRLEEGGNDYPVKAMGIDSLEVSHWQDTAKLLQAIIYLSS